MIQVKGKQETLAPLLYFLSTVYNTKYIQFEPNKIAISKG